MISIIIPFEKTSPFLIETLDHIAELNYDSFEVILLPDLEMVLSSLPKYSYPVIVIPTGSVSPAVKRAIGVKQSSGDIVAFIDDDAYPEKEWLSRALGPFSDKTVAAVGGPQLTPENDTFWQKVSGASFLTPLNGGIVRRYWKCDNRVDVDDWPSVNLLVRKSEYFKAGGFNKQYWPGEDTMLCLNIIKNGGRIVYVPDAVVYHHRRKNISDHLRQVGRYGLHRGYFARKYPENSLKLSYMIPSFFLLFVVLGSICSYLFPEVILVYSAVWALYIAVLLYSIFSIYKKIFDLKVSIATLPYITATHFWYGVNFIHGFFTNDLKSRLGR